MAHRPESRRQDLAASRLFLEQRKKPPILNSQPYQRDRCGFRHSRKSDDAIYFSSRRCEVCTRHRRFHHHCSIQMDQGTEFTNWITSANPVSSDV